MRIAGIGCRRGTPLAALVAALEEAGGADALATIPARAAEVGALARACAVPLHLVQVAGIVTPTRSARIAASFRTGSVAEAAAIAASRDRGGGRLIQTRRVFGSAARAVTIAIAEVP